MIVYPMKADQRCLNAIMSISKGITGSVAESCSDSLGLLLLDSFVQIGRQATHARPLFHNDPLLFGLHVCRIFWCNPQISEHVATNRGDVHGLGLSLHFALLSRIMGSNKQHSVITIRRLFIRHLYSAIILAYVSVRQDY